MKTATLASAATLLSTSYAASVTLQTTKCLDGSIPYGEQFAIELNTAQAVAKDLSTVCGLQIISATDNTNVRTIQCQAFRDPAGTQPGSAVFTYDSPALIGTNPKEIQAIKCTIVPTAYAVEKRQINNSTVVSSSALASRSATSSAPVLTLTSIATSSQSSGAQSTITRTTVVGPSSGLPSSSGNATVPSVTKTPSPTKSGNPPENGATGKIGAGMGVVIGAVVALFV